MEHLTLTNRAGQVFVPHLFTHKNENKISNLITFTFFGKTIHIRVMRKMYFHF